MQSLIYLCRMKFVSQDQFSRLQIGTSQSTAYSFVILKNVYFTDAHMHAHNYIYILVMCNNYANFFTDAEKIRTFYQH